MTPALVLARLSEQCWSFRGLDLASRPIPLPFRRNLVIVLAYALMALVRQTEAFIVVAALAGVGWTLSASELWVAAQRAMPGCARGRMNATVIMISQGTMALGGVIWASAAAIAGASYTLLGAAVLFLASLLLAGRLSINTYSTDRMTLVSKDYEPTVASTKALPVSAAPTIPTAGILIPGQT